MVELYEKSVNNPKLLEQQEEIALMTTLLNDTMTRATIGEPGELFARLQMMLPRYKRCASDLNRAVSVENWNQVSGVENALDDVNIELEAIANAGSNWGETIKQVVSLTEQKRKVVESERNRKIEDQQMIDREEAMLFVIALTNAVNKHVQDPIVKQAILMDIDLVLDPPKRPTILQIVDGREVANCTEVDEVDE